MARWLRRLFLGLLLVSGRPAWAAELLGQVVGISDGDTLTLLTADRRPVRIRLCGFDAPESRHDLPP